MRCGTRSDDDCKQAERIADTDTFVSKIVIHERRERFKQNTEQQIDMHPYGNPVKSWLPLQTKEARDGARGPGDLGLRGPERSEDIELSSPGMGSKIRKE